MSMLASPPRCTPPMPAHTVGSEGGVSHREQLHRCQQLALEYLRSIDSSAAAALAAP